MLRWLPTVYWGGHVCHGKVGTARGRVVVIETPDLPVHVDGEPCGRTPVRIEILPGALRLHV